MDMDIKRESRSLSPIPSSSAGDLTPPYQGRGATVSEDTDDYGLLGAPANASTSTSVSMYQTSEGLRERSRTPYSVSSSLATATVKKEEQVDESDHAALSPATDKPASPSSSNSKGKQKAEEGADTQPAEVDNPFACHICLEVPASDDAVLSKCGHLFCWSDLSAWLESNPPTSSSCPVCKSQIKDIQEDVIPIYSGGGTSGKKQIDPRTKPRPRPRVTPAPPLGSTSRGFGNFFGPTPFWDMGVPGAGPGGWTVQAGVFPFPGLSLGWSGGGARAIPPLGGRGPIAPGMYGGLPAGVAPLTPEMQEAARRQQRNALIAFVVMILLFSLLATVGEMDMEY